MELEVHDQAASFAPAVEPFLAEQEAAHNLLLGIVGQAAAGRTDAPLPYLALGRRDGRVCAAAVRTPGRPLVLSVGWDGDGIERLVRDAHSRLGPLTGVLGPTDSAAAFARFWQEAAGGRSALSRRERIYVLDHVEPVPRPPGGLHPATEADRGTLLDWVDAFSFETTGRQDAEASRSMVAARAPGGGDASLCLWKVGARPVSLAGYSRPTRTGICVAPVYTPAAERGHGYATALVADLSRRLLDGGYQRCFLFTDLDNPTPNHIYQRVGYRPVIDVMEHRFTEGV